MIHSCLLHSVTRLFISTLTTDVHHPPGITTLLWLTPKSIETPNAHPLPSHTPIDPIQTSSKTPPLIPHPVPTIPHPPVSSKPLKTPQEDSFIKLITKYPNNNFITPQIHLHSILTDYHLTQLLQFCTLQHHQWVLLSHQKYSIQST